jgi:hypothetical protein
LVPNWVAPNTWVDEAVDVGDEVNETRTDDDSQGGDEQPDIDPNYVRDLQKWKQGREQAQQLGEQVAQTLRGLADQATTLADRAGVCVDRVFNNADTMNTAAG